MKAASKLETGSSISGVSVVGSSTSHQDRVVFLYTHNSDIFVTSKKESLFWDVTIVRLFSIFYVIDSIKTGKDIRFKFVVMKQII